MARSSILALVPHYVASLLLILGTVFGLRYVVGDLGIWVELPIVIAIVLAYPTIVRRLGVAPDAWERSER